MTAIFSVDKMRVFFSKSDVQCFQKDEVGFVHVSYYNFDVRGLFRLYKSTIDFFFFKEKKIPPIQIIVASALSIWIH